MAGSIFDGIDMTDPCAVWPILDRVLLELLAGERATRARFGEDDVEFQKGDVAELRKRINELKAECDAKNGRVRRHAIRGGFVRY